MGLGAFDPLNAGDPRLASAKQSKITITDLARILSIGLSVRACVAAETALTTPYGRFSVNVAILLRIARFVGWFTI